MRARSASPAVAREQLPQPAAILDRDRLPTRRIEHRPNAAGRDVRHHPIQRLAIQIDNPQHLAQTRNHRINQRLPDRVLIQLRVAQQRDLTAALRHIEVPGHVAMRQRAPQRRRGSDPDASRREVDRVRVLGPRWVRLQPAERPQLGRYRTSSRPSR